MPNADWLPAQPGVLVYLPRVDIDHTLHSLSQLSVSPAVQTQSSQISETVVPSLETETPVTVKEEHSESHNFADASSPETLAESEDTEIFDEAVLIESPEPDGLEADGDLLSQLLTAAESDSSRSESHDAAQFFCQASPAFTDFEYTDYLDETDFDEDTPSPSVRKARPCRKARPSQKPKSATEKSGHHFGKKVSLTKTLPIWPKITKRFAETTKKSPNAQSLEDLRALERAPSHVWDEDERELLCVLHRWYCGTDRRAELKIFGDIFNSITGLGLRPHVIRNQFESYLVLYGPEAYPVYGRVFSIPFHDPEGRYTQIRELIELEAQTLQIDLHRRKSEKTPTSAVGRAKYAKSPETRKNYKLLIERAKQGAGLQPPQFTATRSAAATLTSTNDDWEIIEDIELTPEPPKKNPSLPRPQLQQPHLTFRVWDAASRTKFIDGSFVANCFVDWPRPFPSPIALDEPSEIGKILTVLHLSKHGDTPVFISTTNSLLQALSYATSMQEPQIALINLNQACLREQNKVHHAADVFPWLKAQGLAKWARYQGHGEYFIWAEIPSKAVLQTFDLADLVQTLNQDEGCRALLKFDAFDAGKKTTSIASALREKGTVLNTETAQALGKIAATFGFAKSNCTLEHLEDFVARMFDGWSIEKADLMSIHTLSSHAATFAESLGPHAGPYTLQAVMGAFLRGVDVGTKCAARWSRSRSRSARRQRFRAA